MLKDKKEGRYQRIFIQLESLLQKSDNPISRMATIVAILHHKMDYFFWTGFYLINEEKLQVGPYQGAVACQELAQNTGVCWNAILQQKTILVPDVNLFPGHIACDSRSKSEIAVPVYSKENKIIGVLDVDSQELDSFDETDSKCLEKILTLL